MRRFRVKNRSGIFLHHHTGGVQLLGGDAVFGSAPAEPRASAYQNLHLQLTASRGSLSISRREERGVSAARGNAHQIKH